MKTLQIRLNDDVLKQFKLFCVENDMSYANALDYLLFFNEYKNLNLLPYDEKKVYFNQYLQDKIAFSLPSKDEK